VKIIYVKITKCSEKNLWYFDKIGLIFPAIRITDRNHMYHGGYEIVDGRAYIAKGDAKPVKIAVVSK
jgi:hypothetical protein